MSYPTAEEENFFKEKKFKYNKIEKYSSSDRIFYLDSGLTYDDIKISVRIEYYGQDNGVLVSGISFFTKFEDGEPVPKFSSVAFYKKLLKQRRDLIIDCVKIYLQNQELYKKEVINYKRNKSINKDFNKKINSDSPEFYEKVTAKDLIYENM